MANEFALAPFTWGAIEQVVRSSENGYHVAAFTIFRFSLNELAPLASPVRSLKPETTGEPPETVDGNQTVDS